MMLTPGAESTTDELRSEKAARAPCAPTAPTAITPAKEAGYEYGVYFWPVAALFPAEATTTMPCDTA
jgi:hypothetical protein